MSGPITHNDAGVSILDDDSAGMSVDPRAVAVWRWNALVSGFVVMLIAAVGGVVFWAFFPGLWLLAAVFVAGVFGLLVLMVSRYPGAHYRHLRYWVDVTGIRIQEGVFWRSQASLPRVRIQHTDVSQGPLQRRHGVATLKLYTAGSQYTKIELDGLEYGLAIGLRDELQRKAAGDAV